MKTQTLDAYLAGTRPPQVDVGQRVAVDGSWTIIHVASGIATLRSQTFPGRGARVFIDTLSWNDEYRVWVR